MSNITPFTPYTKQNITAGENGWKTKYDADIDGLNANTVENNDNIETLDTIIGDWTTRTISESTIVSGLNQLRTDVNDIDVSTINTNISDLQDDLGDITNLTTPTTTNLTLAVNSVYSASLLKSPSTERQTYRGILTNDGDLSGSSLILSDYAGNDLMPRAMTEDLIDQSIANQLAGQQLLNKSMLTISFDGDMATDSIGSDAVYMYYQPVMITILNTIIGFVTDSTKTDDAIHIYESTDGGSTWSQIGASISIENKTGQKYTIGRSVGIKLNPNNLYAFASLNTFGAGEFAQIIFDTTMYPSFSRST